MARFQPTVPATSEGLLARLGQETTPAPRSFWVVGHGQAEFEAAADLIEALMARYERLEFLFSTKDAQTRAWLRGRYPAAHVLPPPLPLAAICRRYMVNLAVRGVAILGAVGAPERVVLRAANGRAIPTVTVETPRAAASPAPTGESLGAVPERVEHHFVTSSASISLLLESGAEAEEITLLPDEPAARAKAFMAVTADLLMQDLKLIRSKLRPIRNRLERWALKAMDHPSLRRRLAAKVTRYDSVATLREALGYPETILCLGNGPSSEDPEVAKVRYDRLFRVNHVWLDRGFLTQPDMVFTGSKATLAVVRGPIYGLQSIRSEARLLVTRFLQPLSGRIRYATIERFGLFLSEPRWHGIRPTNGAAMLAAAVALQPRRLVIAGIDLFSHPAGTYPGDTSTPNAYSPGHSADSELALLLEALSLYKGELVILSPALRERWEEYQGSARQPRQDAG